MRIDRIILCQIMNRSIQRISDFCENIIWYFSDISILITTDCCLSQTNHISQFCGCYVHILSQGFHFISYKHMNFSGFIVKQRKK